MECKNKHPLYPKYESRPKVKYEEGYVVSCCLDHTLKYMKQFNALSELTYMFRKEPNAT